MPGNASVVCDRCGRTAELKLETKPFHDYPSAQVFVCECGHVIWRTFPSAQQQQQPQKDDKE